jgi:molybdate transport system substrate-binding protein
MKTLSLLASFLASTSVMAAEVQVAVAANFANTMQRIVTAFEQDTGHKVLLTSGATGKFYAQINNGAPFDMLLSADVDTPARLEKEGLAVSGSRFTYAIGRLVLWSPKDGYVDNQGAILKAGDYRHIAIANPKTAPYGAAAIDTLGRLKLLAAVQGKIVQGENIAQTLQFVSTGNAQLGFLALSQVYEDGKLTSGSGWVVPLTMHGPIRQQAVTLKRASANPGARALAVYLKSDKARGIIKSFGYEF